MNKTIQEAVVQQLRDAIITGVYKPGQRLKQRELALQLGCSPIPIREALYRLSADGFVLFDPQRGARVADFNSRELEEMYEVRETLEGLAARRSAERMILGAAKRIRSVLGNMDSPGITSDEWIGFNIECHDSLYACPEDEAGRLEHRRIFQACARVDAGAAEPCAAAHLRRTVRGLIKDIEIHQSKAELAVRSGDEALAHNAPEVVACLTCGAGGFGSPKEAAGCGRSRQLVIPVSASRRRGIAGGGALKKRDIRNESAGIQPGR
jgi:DNA-binding GntR family transcriptional regulator